MASSARSVRSSLLSFIEELSGRCSLFAFRQSQLAFSLRFYCSPFLAQVWRRASELEHRTA